MLQRTRLISDLLHLGYDVLGGDVRARHLHVHVCHAGMISSSVFPDPVSIMSSQPGHGNDTQPIYSDHEAAI